MNSTILMRGICILVVFFTCCGNPHDELVPTKPSEEADFRDILNRLPQNERQDLENFLTRMKEQQLKGGSGIPEGTTVRVALEAQRRWKMSLAQRELLENRLAERQKAEDEKKRKIEKLRKSMLELCSVNVTKKVAQKTKLGSHFKMVLQFRNKGNKDLVFTKGKLQLFDNSDKLLKEVKIPFRKTIKAGKSATSSGNFPYQPSHETDKILAETPLENLKVAWIPMLYKFADGSKIEAEL